MVDVKKIDDRDLVFVNKAMTKKEDQEFSDFLKKRKAKAQLKANSRNESKRVKA